MTEKKGEKRQTMKRNEKEKEKSVRKVVQTDEAEWLRRKVDRGPNKRSRSLYCFSLLLSSIEPLTFFFFPSLFYLFCLLLLLFFLPVFFLSSPFLHYHHHLLLLFFFVLLFSNVVISRVFDCFPFITLQKRRLSFTPNHLSQSVAHPQSFRLVRTRCCWTTV